MCPGQKLLRYSWSVFHTPNPAPSLIPTSLRTVLVCVTWLVGWYMLAEREPMAAGSLWKTEDLGNRLMMVVVGVWIFEGWRTYSVCEIKLLLLQLTSLGDVFC